MKRYFITLLTILIWSPLFAQDINDNGMELENTNVISALCGAFENQMSLKKQVENNPNQKLGELDFNCSENFWTIKPSGVITQWRFVNGVIEEGVDILTGGGIGLGLSGDAGALTFYCSNFPDNEITYYDTQNGWVTIPTTVPLTNNGGYENHQYYIEAVFDPFYDFHINRVLHYFDGQSLEVVDALETEMFLVADVAVDKLGRAWIFKGDSFDSVSSLNVYNSTGLVTSFDISFDPNAGYGSFFLKNKLYIGFTSTAVHPYSIVPVIIDGDVAELGTPIPFFPEDKVLYYDLASCQAANPLTISDVAVLKNEVPIVPNPTFDVVILPDDIDVISVEIVNSTGQLIRTIKQSNIVDFIGLPSGMYFIKIFTEEGTVNKKVLKQ